MTATLAFTALLATVMLIVWLASRKAARAELELKYAKEKAKQDLSAAQVLAEYINLSADELNERVRKKREAAEQRLHNKN